MTPTQEPEAPTPDPVVDRAVWERLRAVARKGQLEWQGARLVQELHAQYPEWVEEWSS